MSSEKDLMNTSEIGSVTHANAGQGEVEELMKRIDTKAADEVDDAILRANGHDAVLQRQFKWISALGLAFSITNSWIGYLVWSCPVMVDMY